MWTRAGVELFGLWGLGKEVIIMITSIISRGTELVRTFRVVIVRYVRVEESRWENNNVGQGEDDQYAGARNASFGCSSLGLGKNKGLQGCVR